MPGCTTKRLLALITLPIAAVLGGTSATASAVPSYAPDGEASITPGVMMYTDGAQCTANFVLRESAGRRYVGYAAHCAGLGGATDTNGCSTPSLPLGTRVRFAEGGNLADDGTTVGRPARVLALAVDARPPVSRGSTRAPTTTSRWCGWPRARGPGAAEERHGRADLHQGRPERDRGRRPRSSATATPRSAAASSSCRSQGSPPSEKSLQMSA